MSESPRAQLTSQTHNIMFTRRATFDCCEMGICKCLYLRLRERGRMAGDLLPSSSVMLSELKCLVRKCSSSAVGWKGNWCSFSWDEHDDCEKQRGRDYKDRRHCIGCPDCQSTAFVGIMLLIVNLTLGRTFFLKTFRPNGKKYWKYNLEICSIAFLKNQLRKC